MSDCPPGFRVNLNILKFMWLVSIRLPFGASAEFNSKCLSPIEVSDLLSNLVLETSYIANKQFKAFKSLEACNQMVSGFVTSVQGAEIIDKINCSCGEGEILAADERSSCRSDCRRKWYTNMRQEK